MEKQPFKSLEDLKKIYEHSVAENRLVMAELILIGCNLPLSPQDLLSLKFNEVDDLKVVCNSRGAKKSVVVDLNKRCEEAIKRLRQFYLKNDKEPTYLFRSISTRTTHLDQPMVIQWVGAELKRLALEIGLPYTLSPSSLSKTYAYHAFVNGVNINEIQRLFVYDGRRQVLKLVGGEDYRNVDSRRDDELERLRELAIANSEMVDFDWNLPSLSDPWMQEHKDVTLSDEFSISRLLEGVFLEELEFLGAVDLLKKKKNIILQGAPGVGKTYLAKKIAQAFTLSFDPSRIEMVQFHQSYAYEDFVQGYRPNGESIQIRQGIFYQFCNRAKADSSNSYVFIIDEINRGNVSKIFGELLMLLERDKRGKDWSIPLTYSQSLEDKFYIPENVFVIGLMNTADRSLSMIDYALRRRFSFITLESKVGTDKFCNYLLSMGVESEVISKLVGKVDSLNKRIESDVENLGPGFCIGHSFFCQDHFDGPYDIAWLNSIFTHEIIPLLNEYWFDDPTTVESLRVDLFS